MPTPKVSFSLPADALAVIDAHASSNRSAALAQIIELYAAILRQERRTLAAMFTPHECGLALDALNGVYLRDETSITYAWHTIVEAMDDDRLHEKWGIDPAALHEKLQALTFPQHVTLCAAVAQWWNRAAAGERPGYGELFDTPRPARPIRVQP